MDYIVWFLITAPEALLVGALKYFRRPWVLSLSFVVPFQVKYLHLLAVQHLSQYQSSIDRCSFQKKTFAGYQWYHMHMGFGQTRCLSFQDQVVFASYFLRFELELFKAMHVLGQCWTVMQDSIHIYISLWIISLIIEGIPKSGDAMFLSISSQADMDQENWRLDLNECKTCATIMSLAGGYPQT